MKIEKPEIDVEQFMINKIYNKKDFYYKYGIQNGLSYEDFGKFEYIKTIHFTSHTTKYFSNQYDLIYKYEEQIYFIKWQKLSKNEISLYFYKPSLL